ncbi:hypothetical protein GGR54DRAFT_625373 [Hypoxylon sp. NC1633]|nr:hypothetical protein GGR54DRAFT_625373 [Hypoxylon sp. NC1633]
MREFSHLGYCTMFTLGLSTSVVRAGVTGMKESPARRCLRCFSPKMWFALKRFYEVPTSEKARSVSQPKVAALITTAPVMVLQSPNPLVGHHQHVSLAAASCMYLYNYLTQSSRHDCIPMTIWAI